MAVHNLNALYENFEKQYSTVVNNQLDVKSLFVGVNVATFLEKVYQNSYELAPRDLKFIL